MKISKTVILSFGLGGIIGFGIGAAINLSNVPKSISPDDYCIECAAYQKHIDNKKDVAAKSYDNVEEKDLWHEKDGYFVSIAYEDSKGKISKRKIKLIKVQQRSNGNIYLIAYCFDKKGMRSFRLDGVKDFFDEDGNKIDKVKVFDKLNIKGIY